MKGESPKSHKHGRLYQRKQLKLDKLAEQRETIPETQVKWFHKGEGKGNFELMIKLSKFFKLTDVMMNVK